jgi:orotidine-5'-phosphate decarboxylase
VLVPGYGAQGASAEDAVVTARADGLGAIVNASRSLMYAYLKASGEAPGVAAAAAAQSMREALNEALRAAGKAPPA